jgi:iron complex outermembrane receptor protein
VAANFERFEHRDPDFQYDLRTLNLEVEKEMPRRAGHEILWGASYRYTSVAHTGSFQFSVAPHPHDHLLGAFVEDQLVLAGDRLRLTLGTKVEHNRQAGWQWQPTARVSWSLGPDRVLWAAVSRAVRTPSDVERGMRVNIDATQGPGGVPVLVSLFGDDGLQAERVTAREAGFRALTTRRLTIDVAAYHSTYSGLIAVAPAPAFFEADPAPAHLVVPLRFANLLDARTAGGEISSSFEPTRSWRLTGSYSIFTLDTGGSAQGGALGDGNVPRHQGVFRSLLRLSRRIDLDSTLFLVGGLPALDVPRYVRADLRAAWRPARAVELTFGIQNLLATDRVEYGGPEPAVGITTVPRQAYGRIRWRF